MLRNQNAGYGSIAHQHASNVPEEVILTTNDPNAPQQQDGSDEVVLTQSDFYPKLLHFHVLLPVLSLLIWICVLGGFFGHIDYEIAKPTKIAASWALWLLASFSTIIYGLRAAKHIWYYPMFSQRFNSTISDTPSLTTPQSHFISLCFHATSAALSTIVLLCWLIAIAFSLRKSDVYNAFSENTRWGGIVAGSLFTAIFAIAFYVCVLITTIHAYKKWQFGNNYQPHTLHPFITTMHHVQYEGIFLSTTSVVTAPIETTAISQHQQHQSLLMLPSVFDFRFLGAFFHVLLIITATAYYSIINDVDSNALNTPPVLIIITSLIFLAFYLLHITRIITKYPKYSYFGAVKRGMWAKIEVSASIAEVVAAIFNCAILFIIWSRADAILSEQHPRSYIVKTNMIFCFLTLVYVAYGCYLAKLTIFLQPRRLMLRRLEEEEAEQDTAEHDQYQQYSSQDDQVDQYASNNFSGSSTASSARDDIAPDAV